MEALYVKAFLLGIVEGLTEFLPVSSTGHLIIASHWLGFDSEHAASSFEVFIQLGAILAVCWYFRARIATVMQGLGRTAPSNRFALNITIAFLPAAVIGLLSYHQIKALLFSPWVVAWAMVIGGVLILLIEWRLGAARIQAIDDIKPRHALQIGCAQVLALIPGASRSGATIMGGLLSGLDRKTATEFSFFLAMPVMFSATVFDLAKNWRALSVDDIGIFGVGFITAFVSALLTVKFLLQFVSRHSFAVFAWYRLAFGAFLLWHYRPGAS